MNRYKKLVRNRKRKELKRNLVKVPCGDTPIIIDISNKEKETQNETFKARNG